ncbi:MAG: Ig-like domain-containing protein [Candidatus Marinimicrobia bacterium]|nr:Ig-like domain-containing protein [Candidatus Neomarinimicrobiota bacterium]
MNSLPAPPGPRNFAPEMILKIFHLQRQLSKWLWPTGAILLWACAAERGPSGGPVDIQGPIIIRVEPPNLTRNLIADQNIVVFFNERVDPVSVPSSLIFTPELDFSTRIRGRRVIIRPAEPFQPDQPYVLTVQRGIRDYQKNSLARAYQFVFTTGVDIPSGHIQGSVIGTDSTARVAVGLFRLGPAGTDFSLSQTIDLAIDGSFSFGYLSDGIYRLVAVEGTLADFPAAIHRVPYALPPADSLFIRGDTARVAMRLSPPLAQPQISSVEWHTPVYLSITFDTPFGEAPPPEQLYPTHEPAVYGYVHHPDSSQADTTLIDLGVVLNQLGEPYRLRPFAIPTPQLVDTLPPTLAIEGNRIALLSPLTGGGSPFQLGRGRITFNEPVRVPPGFTIRVTGRDTVDLPLIRESPLSLALVLDEPDRYRQAAFVGWDITDEAGNAMTDSLITLALTYTAPEATGQVRGTILNAIGRVVVEALDAATGRRTAFTVTDSAAYLIQNVPPGFYTVFAHEQVGEGPLPYYSGRWVPYHRAARFSTYPEDVEVRPRWEVDGIDINFNADVPVSSP